MPKKKNGMNKYLPKGYLHTKKLAKSETKFIFVPDLYELSWKAPFGRFTEFR